MAESETGQEKTESATPKKRQKSREDGQVPKSQEMNTVVMLATGVFMFYLFADDFYSKVREGIIFYIQNCTEPLTEVSYHAVFLGIYLRVIDILWPFFLVFVIMGVVVNVAQVGFLISTKSMEPKLSKLNPLKGIKRIVSMRGLVELIKSLGKIFIIAPVMMWCVYNAMYTFETLIVPGVWMSLGALGYAAFDMALKAIMIMLVMAIIDYTYQRWQHEQDLKMTKEEVKQEMKDIQGDPQIKARIRQIQRDMSRQRMMEEVPEADVVVTNPTEYAVAMKYDQEMQAAPTVVAKGKGLIAKQIKEIAMANDVPLVENRPLAQSLYKMVDVGGFVPPELYKAIAEVLAYVYNLKGKAAQRA